MAARIQILHGELSSSFGFKEGELYVNNSGNLYFGIENSSSAMVFGSKFNEINSLISGLDSSKYTIGSEISLSCIVNSSYPSGCHFEGETIKLEHFSFPSGYTTSNTIFSFEYSEYPSSSDLTLQGIYKKDGIIGKFTIDIGKTTVGSFESEIASKPARVPYIAQYGDPSKFWSVGDYYNVSLQINNILYEIPITILDFNHDIAADPINYGKQKAGMTLGIGGTRKVKDSAPENPGILTAQNWYDLSQEFQQIINGDINKKFYRTTHIKNMGLGQTPQVKPANWGTSAIKQFFDRIDLLNLIGINNITPITVKKNNTNSWSFSTFYTNSYETKDKYFLLSESEVFGTERFYEQSYIPKINIEILSTSDDQIFGTAGCISSGMAGVANQPELKIIDYSKLLNLIEDWRHNNNSVKPSLDQYGFMFIKRFEANNKWHVYYPSLNTNSSSPNYGLISGAGDNPAQFKALTLSDLGLALKNSTESEVNYSVYIIHFINSNLLTKNAFKISCGIEGEQYEFFKSIGTSKFFWSSDNLNYNNGNWERKADITKTAILLRSTANRMQGQFCNTCVGIANSVPSSGNVSYYLTAVRSDEEQSTIYPCFCL